MTVSSALGELIGVTVSSTGIVGKINGSTVGRGASPGALQANIARNKGSKNRSFISSPFSPHNSILQQYFARYNFAMTEPKLTPNIKKTSTGRRARPTAPQWPNRILPLVLLGLALFGAGLVTGWYLWGQNKPVAEAAQAPGLQVAETLNRYELGGESLPAFGPADAPVVLMEFSDYQCPYCKRWHDDVFPQLIAEYGDQIKFVYRNLPVIRANSADAARASYCANEQGAYWQYHEALFSYRYDFNKQSYEQYARDLNLDVDALRDCYASGRYADLIEQELQLARSMGIGSTPTFFVTGIAVVGAQPYDVFKQIIDKELAGEMPGGN
jgi:protein-disulfide isomerase